MKLVVQIPCYNEEATLAETIRDIPRHIDGIDTIEILVIDDGSTDRTSQVARALGVEHLVRNKRNLGLARSFRIGLDQCIAVGADIIVNTDADNQYCGADIPRLVQPILEGRVDVVVGDRQTSKIAHFSWSKRMLQRFGSFVVRSFSGVDVPDAVSGFRAISREAALRINIVSPFSYTIEMLIQVGRKGMAFTSVPIQTNPKTRESRLFKSIFQLIERSGTPLLRPVRCLIRTVSILTGLPPNYVPKVHRPSEARGSLVIPMLSEHHSGAEKVPYLETIRGLACLLLVSYHVVGSDPASGLSLSNDHWLVAVNSAFQDVRMPLFSLVSGIVFASVVRSKSEWLVKVLKKVRRLLLPMATVGTLFYLVQRAVGRGNDQPLWSIYVLPYAHFWFLQATFLLMLFLLTVGLVVNDAARWAPVFAFATALVYLFVPQWHPDVFSSYQAFYLGPFFFLGISLTRYADVRRNGLDRPSVRAATAGLALLCLPLVWAQVTHLIPDYASNAARLAAALATALFVLSWKPVARPLIFIGGASYAIYLFHVFFTAGTRMAIKSVWLDCPPELLFVFGLAAGLIGPIILSQLLVRRPETALLFLGIAKDQTPALRHAALK